MLFHEASVDLAPTLCQAVYPAPEDAMISKTGLGPAFVELSVSWERQISINKHKINGYLQVVGRVRESGESL